MWPYRAERRSDPSLLKKSVKAGGASLLRYSAPSGKRTRKGVAVRAPARSTRDLMPLGMSGFYRLDCLQQPLFRFGAEAPQGAQASGTYRPLELVERADPQFPIEKAHPLGADPGHAPRGPQAPEPSRPLELVGGADPQFPIEKAHPLGADPGQTQQIQDARRVI